MRNSLCARWLAALLLLLCLCGTVAAEDAGYVEEENLYMELKDLVWRFRGELSPEDRFPADIHTGDAGFYPTQWLESRRDVIRAADSAEDLSAIFWMDEGTVSPADESFLEGVFDSAGYGGLPYRYYLREEGQLVAFTGDDGTGTSNHRSVFAVYLQDTDTEPRVSYAYVPFRIHDYGTSEAPLPLGKRQLAMSRATAFVQAYAAMTTADSDIVMVSDMEYEDAFLGPYTYVWIFDHSWTEDGASDIYDPVDPSRNEGFEVIIGLDEDRVLGLTRVRENVFVNRAQAEADWTSRTGQTYPIMDSDYMRTVIGPRLSEELDRLASRYREELTLWEQQQADQLAAQRTANYLSFTSDWALLRDDLDACRDARSLVALLHKDYLGITESYEGEPQREEYEALARDALAAMGMGRADLVTLIYRENMRDGTFYTVCATQSDPEMDAFQPYVNFDLWADGRVDFIWCGLWGLAPAVEPLTEAQREAAIAAAVDFAGAYAYHQPAGDEGEAYVAALWTIDTGETLAQVWVPLGERDYYGEMRITGLDMKVGLEDGIVYEMIYSAL